MSLNALPGLDGIALDRIGALAKIADVAADPSLSEHLPGLVEAARAVSSPTLRNLGTVGGNLLLDTRCWYFNQSRFWRGAKGPCMKAEGDECLVVPQKEICYATYSGDLAPVLLVLDAQVELFGPRGRRTVPLRTFFAFDGIRRFVKRPDEVLLSVRIPGGLDGLRTGYRKLRPRDVLDYPVAGVALGLRIEDGRISDLRVAVTGTEAVPLYYGDFDLTGRAADEAAAEDLRAAVYAKVRTYRNVPFPPGYRRAMAAEFARALFLDLAGLRRG